MCDVVIAGAGPTGLFLACELQLAGVAVLVMEQMHETRTPLKEGFMGGRGLNLLSVEAFYRRGLLPAVRETALGWMVVGEKPGISMTPNDSANPPLAPRFAGHFAGIMLDGNKIDFSKDKYLAGGPSASGGIVSLAGLEDVLRERAEKLGVAIRLGTPVIDFEQDADGVGKKGRVVIRVQQLCARRHLLMIRRRKNRPQECATIMDGRGSNPCRVA